MTTLELQAWKNLLAEIILQTDDIHLLKAIETLIKKEREPLVPPCQYTVEELRERVRQSLKDAEMGLGQDINEVLKEMETW